MKIDRKLIRRVAKIARLNLTKKEVTGFERDFKEILKEFSELKKINTKGIEPSVSPLQVLNVSRKDRVKKSLTRSEALSNTKNKERGFFKGPKTI